MGCGDLRCLPLGREHSQSQRDFCAASTPSRSGGSVRDPTTSHPRVSNYDHARTPRSDPTPAWRRPQHRTADRSQRSAAATPRPGPTGQNPCELLVAFPASGCTRTPSRQGGRTATSDAQGDESLSIKGADQYRTSDSRRLSVLTTPATLTVQRLLPQAYRPIERVWAYLKGSELAGVAGRLMLWEGGR